MTHHRELREYDINLPVQLLVEGNYQRNFFSAMLEFLNVKNCAQIQNFGGTRDLRNYLLAFSKQRRFSEIVKRIGVV